MHTYRPMRRAHPQRDRRPPCGSSDRGSVRRAFDGRSLDRPMHFLLALSSTPTRLRDMRDRSARLRSVPSRSEPDPPTLNPNPEASHSGSYIRVGQVKRAFLPDERAIKAAHPPRNALFPPVASLLSIARSRIRVTAHRQNSAWRAFAGGRSNSGAFAIDFGHWPPGNAGRITSPS